MKEIVIRYIKFRPFFLSVLVCCVAFLWTGRTFSASPQADKYYNEGMKFARNQDFISAIKYFNKAVHIDPDMKSAWYEMGNAYFNLKKYEKAVESYYVALDIDPQYTKALKKLGAVFILTNKYDLALLKLQEAQKVDEGDPDVYYLIGICYEQKDQLVKATDSYMKAYQMNPDKYQMLKSRIDELLRVEPTTEGERKNIWKRIRQEKESAEKNKKSSPQDNEYANLMTPSPRKNTPSPRESPVLTVTPFSSSAPTPSPAPVLTPAESPESILTPAPSPEVVGDIETDTATPDKSTEIRKTPQPPKSHSEDSFDINIMVIGGIFILIAVLGIIFLSRREASKKRIRSGSASSLDTDHLFDDIESL